MGTIDKFPEMVKFLKDKKCSPTKIAKQIEADKRTVDKMIKVGTELNILECKSLEISGKQFMTCTISADFKRLMKKEGK